MSDLDLPTVPRRGNPAMKPDAYAFRKTIGLFATGVTVIAAEVDGAIHGMTANAFASLSLDPLLVLVCIGKSTRMAEFLKKAAGFSISILRDDHEALSAHFAGTRKELTPPPHRFVPWHGGPRLEGCIAALGCVPQEWLEGGTTGSSSAESWRCIAGMSSSAPCSTSQARTIGWGTSVPCPRRPGCDRPLPPPRSP